MYDIRFSDKALESIRQMLMLDPGLRARMARRLIDEHNHGIRVTLQTVVQYLHTAQVLDDTASVKLIIDALYIHQLEI